MSLILEALRKSEAERQRGRAPGLFVEQVATRPSARPKAPGWAWGLGVGFVVLALVFGWREWSRLGAADDGSVEAAGASADGRDAASRDAMASSGGTAEPDASAGAVPGALPDVAPGSRPPPGGSPATVAPDAPASARATNAETAAIAAMPPGPAAESPKPTTPFTMTAPGTGGATPPRADAAMPTLAPSTAVSTSVPSPAPPAPREESLPTLASLDAGTRASLPPLKLSMHVYADVPAQRFVILDGQRLGEGASPAAGIVLEEIRRDGLVLSVNGQRLLLARP